LARKQHNPRPDRAAKIVKATLENPKATKTEILESVGYATSTAKTNAYVIYDSPNVRAAFKAAMAEAGLTPEYLAEKLCDGMEAWKVQTSPTEMDKKIPDFQARHRYLTTALRAQGIEGAKQVDVSGEVLHRAVKDEVDRESLLARIAEIEKEEG